MALKAKALSHEVHTTYVGIQMKSSRLLFNKSGSIFQSKDYVSIRLATRRENEKKFQQWEDHDDGTRTYWYEVLGKHGWRARYIKHVDANEDTIAFRQEVYNEQGELAEIHEKYPVDKRHQALSG